MAKNEHDSAKAKAREVRERFRRRGEFTQQQFHDALYEALRSFDVEAYEGFVAHIAECIDKEAIKEKGLSAQPDLPGWDWDLEGEYRLGQGRRIAKRKATLSHLDEVLANDEMNVSLVLSASSRKHNEVAKLRPYFPPGGTKEEAIAAYNEDHPE